MRTAASEYLKKKKKKIKTLLLTHHFDHRSSVYCILSHALERKTVKIYKRL